MYALKFRLKIEILQIYIFEKISGGYFFSCGAVCILQGRLL